eukprot:2396928-Alexandrium_andersonii.AAC.1
MRCGRSSAGWPRNAGRWWNCKQRQRCPESSVRATLRPRRGTPSLSPQRPSPTCHHHPRRAAARTALHHGR